MGIHNYKYNNSFYLHSKYNNMAEGDVPRKSSFTVGKLILGVSTGTVLAGLVLMGVRHLVVIIRTKSSTPAPPAAPAAAATS
jgi:hypothetical protein